MRGKSSYPLLRLRAPVRHLCLMTAVLALIACHHGGTSNNNTYTLGGPITGLNASSVELVNGTATVTVAAGASTWVFPTAFVSQSSYSVTVATQPAGEVCEVTSGGSGTTLTGDVDNVTVGCSVFGQWTWEGGSDTVNAAGIYGTLGAASASNAPGARYDSSSWTDSSGTLWLFGGFGYDSTGALGSLNDLWQYTPSTGLWTWVNGASTVNASGVYGTQGTAAAGNVPGARYSASSWTVSGNLWLFGGYGYDSIGTVGKLNDLWQFTTSSGQWTWINGQDGANPSAIYGTLGSSTANNLPGARQAATSWTDSSGYLWLFGGVGFDSTGAVGNLNDLWRYIPSVGQWTWVSGANVENATGFYGTEGSAGAGNVSGARNSMSPWIDSSGNMWLFGGYGYDSNGNLGYLNDLWQYDPTT